MIFAINGTECKAAEPIIEESPAMQPAPEDGDEIDVGSAVVQDDPFKYHMSMGIVGLANEEYEAAVYEFNAALKEQPDNYEALLYYGIALSRRGDKEAEYVLKRAMYVNPADQRVALELGMYYMKEKIYPEALDYFEITVDNDPQSHIAESALKYISDIGVALKEQPWTINLETGFQYDGNVSLESFGESASEKSDWRNYIDVGAGYDFLKRDSLTSSAGFSLYRNVHSSMDEYNTTVLGFTMKALNKMQRKMSLTGIYSFNHVLVGGESFSSTHSVMPILIVPEAKGYYMLVRLGYERSAFNDTDMFKENSFRSGAAYSAAIVQHVHMGDAAVAKAGISAEKAEKEKDFWDYSGLKGMIALDLQMPLGIKAALSGGYEAIDYKGESPATGETRIDGIQTYSVEVKREIIGELFLTVSGTYTLHGSNIGIYDFERIVTGIDISRRF